MAKRRATKKNEESARNATDETPDSESPEASEDARSPAGSAAGKETPTFEESVQELQQIVGQLEDGSLPLEESMVQFERGIGLLRNCYQVLEQAEQRIEILTGMTEDGIPETEELDAAATIDRDASTRSTSDRTSGTSDRTSGGKSAPRRGPTSDESLF